MYKGSVGGPQKGAQGWYWRQTDQKGLPEETVAHLFTTGFLAAAISASFVGSLADRYGRRHACLFFCILYSMSCFTVLCNSIIILFFGRILGGLSTTLMYSVFESWMVTEYHRQHLNEAGGSLDDVFGIMTTLNGVVAIIAGLFSQGVTDFSGTQAAPFMTAVLLLFFASGIIYKRWVCHCIILWNSLLNLLPQGENYGDSANVDKLPSARSEKEKNGFQYILSGT